MKRNDGFTLVEILIAVTIFAVGILAVAALQSTGLRAATQAHSMSKGKCAAKSVAERLMLRPYDHAELSDRDGDREAGLGDVGEEADHCVSPAAGQLQQLQVCWNLAADQPRSGLKTVRIIALWQEFGCEKRTILEFIKFRAL